MNSPVPAVSRLSGTSRAHGVRLPLRAQREATATWLNSQRSPLWHEFRRSRDASHGFVRSIRKCHRLFSGNSTCNFGGRDGRCGVPEPCCCIPEYHPIPGLVSNFLQVAIISSVERSQTGQAPDRHRAAATPPIHRGHEFRATASVRMQGTSRSITSKPTTVQHGDQGVRGRRLPPASCMPARRLLGVVQHGTGQLWFRTAWHPREFRSS